MSDDLTDDEEYIETCRTTAWAYGAEPLRYWDPVVGNFIWPSGWPEGVDPDVFIRGQLARAHVASPVLDGEDLSPSVQRLREMLS